MFNKQRVGVIALAVMVTAITIMWLQRDTSPEVKKSDAEAVSIKPIESQAREKSSSVVPTSVLASRAEAILDALLLDAVLHHVARGGFIKDSPEFQLFLDLAVQDHRTALALLDEKIKMVPAHETVKRSQVFAVLLEIGIAMKSRRMPSDELIRDAQPLIHKQLADPERVLLPEQDFTPEQISGMVHHGEFIYIENKMYATTLKAKYLAMSLLIETGTMSARAAMEDIVNNESFEPNVRDIARNQLRSVIWH
jgi:hypothetical protein